MTVSFPVGDIAATFLRLPGFDPGDAGFLILPGQLRFHKASIGKNGSLCLYRTASGHHARRPQGRPGDKKDLHVSAEFDTIPTNVADREKKWPCNP
jgi:hypothetical protein